jgi:hypothetical protein
VSAWGIIMMWGCLQHDVGGAAGCTYDVAGLQHGVYDEGLQHWMTWGSGCMGHVMWGGAACSMGCMMWGGAACSMGCMMRGRGCLQHDEGRGCLQ